MKYVALLRGINVGGNHAVSMKELTQVFTALGFVNVSTYINSGNVIFDSAQKPSEEAIEKSLAARFGFVVPVLVKSARQMEAITKAIPPDWLNDAEQRTDVAYLFAEADSKDILAELPIDEALVDVRYVKGALFWNVSRADVMKSRLNKLIGHKLYKLMTIRNVNTARTLAEIAKQKVCSRGHSFTERPCSICWPASDRLSTSKPGRLKKG